MLIVVEFFVKNQSEWDSSPLSWTHDCHPLLNWKRNQKNLSRMMIHYGCLFYKLIQSCHWSVQKKCGTCFLDGKIVCLLPFPPTPSILKAKMEDGGYKVVASCAGSRFDQGAKKRKTYLWDAPT